MSLFSADRDEIVTRLLRGAVDLHVHSGPPLMDRRLDHVEAARDAEAAGMAALALFDHSHSVTPTARLLEKYEFRDSALRLLSGIALNNATGGFNRYAVEHTLKLGGRIVWMPTISATNHIRQTRRPATPAAGPRRLPAKALSVLDDYGVLRDPVLEILDLIASADAVLATGHLHLSEIFPLLTEAKSRGVKRLLVNHPSLFVGATPADMAELAGMGAYLEHCAYTFLDGPGRRDDPAALQLFIAAAGVKRTILSSDLGQSGLPRPVDGLRALIGICLDLGYSEAEIVAMTAINPAALVGIELTREAKHGQ